MGLYVFGVADFGSEVGLSKKELCEKIADIFLKTHESHWYCDIVGWTHDEPMISQTKISFFLGCVAQDVLCTAILPFSIYVEMNHPHW